MAAVLILSLLFSTVSTFAVPDQQQVPLEPFDHSQGYQFDPLLHLPGMYGCSLSRL